MRRQFSGFITTHALLSYNLVAEAKLPAAKYAAAYSKTMVESTLESDSALSSQRLISNLDRQLRLVSTHSELTDRETGEVIKKEDIMKGFVLGKDEGERSRVSHDMISYFILINRQQIVYKASELKAFRNFGLRPGISILGFRDADVVKIDHQIGHALFMYPSEKVRLT